MIAGPALAADIPVKAKAPPPVAYYDWSGVYIGVSLGGVWAEVDRFYPRLDLRARPSHLQVAWLGLDLELTG
jgi:hypothetical protein